jgi:hypothetical protein
VLQLRAVVAAALAGAVKKDDERQCASGLCDCLCARLDESVAVDALGRTF